LRSGKRDERLMNGLKMESREEDEGKAEEGTSSPKLKLRTLRPEQRRE